MRRTSWRRQRHRQDEADERDIGARVSHLTSFTCNLFVFIMATAQRRHRLHTGRLRSQLFESRAPADGHLHFSGIAKNVNGIDARLVRTSLVALDKDAQAEHLLKLDVAQLDRLLAFSLCIAQLEGLLAGAGGSVIEAYVRVVVEQLDGFGRLI